jgi:hypothetical protein
MHALIGGIVDHHCSNFRSQPCHEERNISKKVTKYIAKTFVAIQVSLFLIGSLLEVSLRCSHFSLLFLEGEV